ncbi:hypothetical protein V496_07595 [Pseudogymnoascus sp. VKM F-4515 (FW-2607)]|nr:hypothetical protein V496_07595 [Pseudogymnoascus sp. VKM F-4515 (FW-2607)]
MSNSTREDSSLPHYIPEDTPSTSSTPSIDFSDRSSPTVSSSRRTSDTLVNSPAANLPQVNSVLASTPATNYPPGNTPLAVPPELIYPRASSPRPIPPRSIPREPPLPKFIFPRANPPLASFPVATYPRGTASQANPLQTDPFEIDLRGPSGQSMMTCPHIYRQPQHGDVHSIFLRAFHSPWSGIGRRLALAIRGFVSVYMTVTFVMVVAWQAKTEETASMVMFKFETISFFWQVAYSWITFTWALMHLVSPCDSTKLNHSVTDSLKIVFRYPLTDRWRQRFSIFYTGAVSLPNVVALVYWTIVVPHDVVDVGDLFSNGDLQSFCIINLYFISLVVALIEVFFLSSIKPPGPFFVHVLWLSAIAVGYYVWAFLGHILTGNYMYFFLDPEKVGEENVVAGLIAFVLLLNIFYGVAYGISSARDALTGPLEIFGELQLPKVTPKIIETIIRALPHNDTTQQELNNLVEEIQNVQNRYLLGDNLDNATTKNSELGESSEPETTHQSKPVPTEKHHWKQGEWSQKYGAIFDKTRIPAQNLQTYIGESLEQIDALVLNTLPDILGKRLLRKFYEDLRWMSAKYYGDPTDDAEFKRLLNKRGSNREKKARQREKKHANSRNMQNMTVEDAGAAIIDGEISRETEGDSDGKLGGTGIENDGSCVEDDEEGAFHPHDHMSLQAFDNGQLSTMSDDHSAKPLEPQTAMRSKNFYAINTPTFTIKSNGSYLHNPLVVRPASESPLKRKSEASPEVLSMGKTIQEETAPSDTLMKETSDTIVDKNRGHPDGLCTRIKVEESPTPASLLKRVPHYLEFDDRNMASPEAPQHSPTRIVEATGVEKRKRAELDTEDREAKFPKIAEEGHISRTSGQTKSDHGLAEHGQIEEPGLKIGTLDRPPKLSLDERVQNQCIGQKQSPPHEESGPYIPTIDLRNSVELSNSRESNSPQERKCVEPPLNERLTTLGELDPVTPKLTRRERKTAFMQNKAKKALAIKPSATPDTVIAAADTETNSATNIQQNQPETFLESPNPHMGSISGDGGADTPANSLPSPVAASQNKSKQRKQRQKLVKKAQGQDRPIADLGLVSETGILTAADAPNRPIETLSINEGNTAVTQTLCSDGELRPRGDEDDEMLVFVGWEATARSKPGDNGLFNPVELYSKFLQPSIDDNRFGNRTDQAAMLVYVILGIGSSCAIAQFGRIAAAMREEFEVAMEFLPGHERYGRAALRLTLGPDEGPFKPFAESILALEFYRFLEDERAIQGEMLPLTARGIDFTRIQELENSLPPRHGRGANLRALQQIGFRLSKLTSIYGDGILALIPSSGRFGDCLNVLSNMDEASFRVFQHYMDKNHDQFLLKVSPLLEPYVREGMWGTLNLPKLRLELDRGLNELAVKDRSDQLASMCLPSWSCIRLTHELSFQWEEHAPAAENTRNRKRTGSVE